MSLSGDGVTLVTAACDDIAVWIVPDHRQTARIKAQHPLRFDGAALSHDGSMIATAGGGDREFKSGTRAMVSFSIR